eukprot:scaffold569382_cov71-Attheya_sp.AAC.1
MGRVVPPRNIGVEGDILVSSTGKRSLDHLPPHLHPVPAVSSVVMVVVVVPMVAETMSMGLFQRRLPMGGLSHSLCFVGSRMPIETLASVGTLPCQKRQTNLATGVLVVASIRIACIATATRRLAIVVVPIDTIGTRTGPAVGALGHALLLMLLLIIALLLGRGGNGHGTPAVTLAHRIGICLLHRIDPAL